MKKAKDMVRASLIADSLALGVHWIYDPKKVASLFASQPKPLAPPADSYHKAAQQGDFTHYGDQILVLLESVATLKAYRLEDWAARWKKFFTNNYKGYLDHATQETLAHFQEGRSLAELGSMSTDLAPAARMAPIFLIKHESEESAIAAAKSQASLTTRQAQTLELVEFFAVLNFRVLKGSTILGALTAAQSYLKDQNNLFLFQSGLDSAKEDDSVAVINRFGASCDAFKMFPGVIHLLAKYHERPYDGLMQSILAGGDNAVRTSLIAITLAAAHGSKFMPASWYDAVKQKERIENYLTSVPLDRTDA